MAVVNATLYGSSYHASGSTLYSVNPTNGSLTDVGATSVECDDFGSTANQLFIVDVNANLYSINSATGASTLIGPIGLSFEDWRCLSTGGTNLYFSNGESFYTINTNTGAAAYRGVLEGLQFGTMLVEGTNLYCGENDPNYEVDTFDPITVKPALGSDLTGVSEPFYGLASYPLPPPNLSIAQTGNSFIVSWPNTGSFTLQVNSSLAVTAGWATSGYTVTTNSPNGTNSITISPPPGNLFFRLVST
jgi:hypothetical protein